MTAKSILKDEEVHYYFADCFPQPGFGAYAFWLSKKMAEGHICIDVEELYALRHQLPFENIISPADLLLLTDIISTDAETIKPFLLLHNKLYLHRYFSYETSILQALKHLLAQEKNHYQQRTNELLAIADTVKSLASTIPSQPGDPPAYNTDWQLVAALLAYCHNFTIITGGPGTGKTTTVAKVLSLLYETYPDLKVALAAPTGKAAMRMGESLKATTLPLSANTRQRFNELEPATLHRLLGFRYDSIYFKHDALHPLPYDVVIIDEASMIDVAMFAKLLSAIGNSTRLILLGDRNQLASVEAGSLFGDLCRLQDATALFSPDKAAFINSFIPAADNHINADVIGQGDFPLMHHIIELKKSHRFGSNSGIGKFSRAIIENDTVALNAIFRQNTWSDVLLDTTIDPQHLERMIENYTAYIGESDPGMAIKAFNRFRILCAVKDGDRGVYAMNKLVERLLKKWNLKNADGSLFNPEGEFYENRPVIITQNNKELELFNGDVGLVRKKTKDQYRAYFEGKDGNIRELPVAFIGKCETVFAMTIHKSQGSEYDNVLVVMPTQKENQLLTRELLYTAVTRAKQLVMVSATEAVMMQTAAQSVSRASGINYRYRELTD